MNRNIKKNVLMVAFSSLVMIELALVYFASLLS
ncbi:hypothetical protein HNQ55_003228 [Thalassotalea piscium]|uniref:Uncharacterized protein n=1 Tax=Thalassotalea piscium TaxID=1230533 RepID=A0A7X0TV26_9GAMM|nr:hypothetical protein [Thalassotalea piscium]